MSEPAPTPEHPVRPPLPWLAGYRVLGLRLPERYRPWVARDVVSKGFLTWRMSRTFVWLLALVGLYWLTQTLLYERPSGRFMTRLGLVAAAIALLASGKTLVRRTLRWQRVNKHGRPVAPKGLAVLDNVHMVLLGIAVLVAFTGTTSLVALELRPQVASCPDASDEIMTRIRLGVKDQETRLYDAKQVDAGGMTIVALKADIPGQERNMLWLYLVQGDTIYELRQPVQDELSPTSFPTYPNLADRGVLIPLQRIAPCLDVKGARR